MKNFFLSILVLILLLTEIHGQTIKKLTIKGLKIFTEDEIYSHLNLKRFDDEEISISQVIYEIENFYKENGYSLVKVYSTIVKSDKRYELFVDEGKIGKIIIHDINNYHLLKFKQIVKIPKRIYNSEVINQNLKKLQKEFPKFDISVNVLKTPDYESNILQLDREFKRIKALGRFDVNFLTRYAAPNDLHFFVADKDDKDFLYIKNTKIEVKFHYAFPSTIIPQVFFNRDHTFFEKDYFKSVFSIGYDFVFKELIKKDPSFSKFVPHEMSFAEFKYEYKIGLIDIENDFFGPLVNGKLYRSHTSRGDLGITRFDYSYVRTVLAPEWAMIKNFNIYAGLGVEELSIKNTIIDYQKDRYLEAKDTTCYSNFAEVRLKFDPIKINIGNKIDRYVILTYTNYFYGSKFKQLELSSIYETEFDNLSILSLSLKGFKLFGKPEFYRSEEVSDKYFLGFIGEYYTNNKIAISSEYRFSIYRDLLYIGAFFDSTIFKPEGYIISGTKFGIGYGPTARLLVYDQYQLIVYYGFDVLYPDKHSGFNLNIKFSRRW
ncbi:MAG: hypothetical protein FWF73_07050 [Spirochaetes bacterium]|nr:hypothetical protein [Spirochaetota bacterium]